MSEQEKDRRNKKSPRNSKNSPRSSKNIPENLNSETKVDDETSKIAPELKDNVTEQVVKGDQKVKEDLKEEKVEKIDAEDDGKVEVDEEEEEAPTLSGWLASGFSSIVKTAKDTVNKPGMLEAIRRDLGELKATVQSTSASSVLNSTASMVKNTLNEIGATVNEISSLGTSLPDDEYDDGNDDKSQNKPNKKEISEKKGSIDRSSSLSGSTSEENSLFNFTTLNNFAHKFGESARSTLTAVKDVVVDSLALKNVTGIDELEEDAFVFHNGVMLPLPELPVLLKQIQTDGRTFIKEPEGSPEMYEEWLTTFSLIDYEKQMQHLIESVPELASIRETLVPEQLSDNDFWHRYYYRAHLLKLKLKNEAIELFEKQNKNSTSGDGGGKAGDAETISKPASVASSSGSAAQLSRSSTDDWDKVDSKQISDDEKDWVKCD